MNPFDLAGPQFLLFYGVLGFAAWGWIHFARLQSESGTIPKLDVVDPYLIAYLRGGTNEAARVAMVALIDRGLLVAQSGDTLVAKVNVTGLRSRLEQAIVDTFKKPSEAKEVYSAESVDAAGAEYRTKLMQLRLMPDEAMRGARNGRMLVALALLLGVALIKIYVALSRGHRNVGFLVMMAVGFVYLVYKESTPLQTTLGRNLLADMRRLFARLEDRALTLEPGGGTAEVALLAGVFGVSALPGVTFPYVGRLFPKAKSAGSCGSACGSSCGGGGGCGGGCGGCGS